MSTKTDTSKAGNAREKLIEVSYELVLTKGYSATTVDELCEAAGVSKGSFYHFFKSKEELGLALLDDFLQQSKVRFLGGDFRMETDPMKRMFGFLEHTEKYAHQLWSKGCILGTFAGELGNTGERIREKISSMFQGVVEGVAEFFLPVEERFPGNELYSAKRLAELYIVLIEGAIVLCRAYDDFRPLERSVERFRIELTETLKQTE